MNAAKGPSPIKMATESRLGLGVGIALLLVGLMLLIMSLVEGHLAADVDERGVPVEVSIVQKGVSERWSNDDSDSWWVYCRPTGTLLPEARALWDRAVVESQAPNARGLRPDWGDVIAVHLGIKDDPAYPEGSIHTLLVAGDRWRFDIPPFDATWPGLGAVAVGIGLILLALRLHRRRRERIAARRAPRPASRRGAP